GVFDHVFGSLGDDPAVIVEAFAPGAAGDLVKIAGGEDGDAFAAVFREASEKDGADRDVDANAEGVGAADDFKEAALGETLDKDAVFGEQTGVVEANAVAEKFLQVRAVRAVELKTFERGPEGGFFFASGEVLAHEVLGGVGALELGEVDD